MILEDEPTLLEMLTLHLEHAGFLVSSFQDYPSASQGFKSEPPDLAILDIQVPGGDGLELLKEIRLEAETPVIVISTRGAEMDRVLGLELGADDYLPKPFSARELVTRVKTVLRRVRQNYAPKREPEAMLEVGCLALDLDGLAVRCRDTWTSLTPLEFQILHKLMKHPGQTFTRNQLQSGDPVGDSRAIDNHINNLRRKIESLGWGVPSIQSVRGVGYRLGTP